MPTLHCPVCGERVEPRPVMIQMFPRLTLAAQALMIQCRCGVAALVGLAQPAEQPATKAEPTPQRRGGYDEPYTYTAPTVDRPQPFTLQEFAGLLKLRGRVLDERLAALLSQSPAGQPEDTPPASQPGS